MNGIGTVGTVRNGLQTVYKPLNKWYMNGKKTVEVPFLTVHSEQYLNGWPGKNRSVPIPFK